MRTMIIDELRNRGYYAEEHITIKNGVELTGIAISKNYNDMIRPVVYENNSWSTMSVDEVCNNLIEIFNNANIPEFNDTNISKEYMKNRSRIVAQRGCSDNVWSADIYDLKACIRILMDDDHSYLVPKNLYFDGLYEAAVENTIKNVTIDNIVELMLSKMIEQGCPENIAEEIAGQTDDFMYVISNTEKQFGSGYIFLNEIFDGLCKEHDVELCWIIPSSVHELIFIPLSEEYIRDFNYDGLRLMIEEVNVTELSMEDKLEDHPYLYSAITKEIFYKEEDIKCILNEQNTK